LNTLKPSDINEVKSLKTPPAGVKLVMQAVCVMMGVKPDKIKDPEGGMKKVNDYWGPSKKLMSDTKFLDKLKTYDKDNIKEKVMKQIRDSGKFKGNPDFTPEAAKKSSVACAGMCQWVLAMEVYDRVAKVVAPKKLQLAEAEKELKVVMDALKVKQDELAVVEGKLKTLQDNFDAAVKKKAKLEADVKLCGEKLVRAEELINGLGGERVRWTGFGEELNVALTNLTGDVLISAGVIAYLGSFTSQFRDKATSDWAKNCVALGVPCSAKPTLNSTLGDPIKVQAWNINGLPADDFSTDNAIVVFNSQRWPLMIDPQGQANKWIRNMEEENAKNEGMPLQVIRQSQSDFLRTIENSVQFGNPVLLENVLEELDPSLEPLLLKQIFKQGGVECIRLGDSTVEYNTDFRFYITTKLPNPHYLPEVAVKVTVLNFMITPVGLEEQLVGIVVAKERPDLEKQKQELIVAFANNKRILKETEDTILHILSTSEGNILEDASAIEAIKKGKAVSDDIKAKQAVAEETGRQIDEVRQGYKPVAFRAQLLFFCIADLAAVEPVYQYSLVWFINLFVMGIEKSEKDNNVQKRLKNLNEYFTYSLYLNIMRSLLEKDKLLFSFLLTVRILKGDGKMDAQEWYFLLTGGVAMDNPHMNPTGKNGWLSSKSWGEICRLSDLPAFKGLRDHFLSDTEEWQTMYDVTEAHRAPLPEAWKHLNGFQFLLVLRCIRPDKVMLAVQDYVIAELGKKFVEPPPFDLEACYNDSTCQTPLVFILSPGSDPMASLLKYSEELKTNLDAISLGQGQGPVAVRMINKAKEAGTWVILQNCHLAVSWMKDLELLCEALHPDSCHLKFRLWLTTYPSKDFPVSVLQNGVKMTNEAPKGLKNNLMGSYTTDPISDEAFFDSVRKGEAFRKLLYALCFFHALIQERRQFGALGWNIPYEFNESDLRISVRQLAIFLDDDKDELPFKALNYTAGECNYGGRVTDDKDRTTLRVILRRFYDPYVLEENAYLGGSEDQAWNMVPDGSLRDYVENISKLPLVAQPEIFGMHPNANITKDQNETNTLFAAILVTQGSGSGADVDMEGTVVNVASALVAKLPPNYDMEEAALKYPVKWSESMNTVLNQELLRFNTLSSTIRKSLIDVQMAIKGLIVMGDELEEVFKSLFFGRVPKMWEKKSYPSLKPLAGYFTDFLLRLQMFAEWLSSKPPAVFWISGFYFTQAFLTGSLQNFARKYTVPIDKVIFDFQMMPKDSYKSKPKDGVYIRGLFIEGCRYDRKSCQLEESAPKVLYTLAPIIWLKPKADDGKGFEGTYSCPVYKTSERRGMLSTTGHSTNFVMMIEMPSAKPSAHWTGRGVAMLTQLDD
jgi:dynein heavy chain